MTYHADLNSFLSDLSSGYYIQYTLDNLLQDVEGRQLLIETVYLYGSMLLLMEKHIPGPVRERIIVAHYRYTEGGEGALEDVDKVCKLCRSTNYTPGTPKPKKYESRLFKRLPLPPDFCKSILSRLLLDDVYLRSSAFPDPSHRSVRLFPQGSMVYVVLYFCTDLMMEDERGMREVVDRFFNDNWIISLYMGMTVDLSLEWASYPAAIKALLPTLAPKNVKILSNDNSELIKRCMSDLKVYLTEGQVTPQYVLDNTDDILNAVRRCNVALKWRLCHRRTQEPKLKGIIDPSVPEALVIKLLLRSAELEMKVKTIFKALLDGKQEKWDKCKEGVTGRMTELSDYFTGEKALTRVEVRMDDE